MQSRGRLGTKYRHAHAEARQGSELARAEGEEGEGVEREGRAVEGEGEEKEGEVRERRAVEGEGGRGVPLSAFSELCPPSLSFARLL